MPSITFKTSFKKNQDLVFSAQEIKDIYLYGIDTLDVKLKKMSDESIEFYIAAAQQEVENYLSVKLKKQNYKEDLHFYGDDWKHWGFVKTTYPVHCVVSLKGFINKVKQVNYPREWLSTKKGSDETLYHRSIYLVPVGGAQSQTQNAVYSGLIPQLGYINSQSLPFYWEAQYATGFDVIPADIMNAVGKLAAISLFYVAGDLALGTPGISSKSIGIDGLSQSFSSSAPFNTRIKGYNEELQRQLPNMRDHYRGFNFGVC